MKIKIIRFCTVSIIGILLIGTTTGDWIKPTILCPVLSFINEFLVEKKK